MTEIPVVWFDGPDIEAVAYAIADNRTHEFSDWDEPALAKLLEELRAEDSLDGVGYTDADIDELLAELAAAEDEGEVDDRARRIPPRPRSRGPVTSGSWGTTACCAATRPRPTTWPA
jgi:hypothetical protein